MKILVVDDEKNVRDSIRRFLLLEDVEVAVAENGLSAQRLLRQEPFSAAVIDLKMPGMDGLQLLRWIREEGLRLPVIMISAYGEIRDAVEAMKLGARDYIVKPFDPEELHLRLRRIHETQTLLDRVELGRRTSGGGDTLIGESPAMREIRRTIGMVAATPSSVLITGESGTGKEVIARSIHARSDRSEGPFTAVNIAGIPDTLLESELFGYERGAFTGADARKNGLFELASEGTLFLDEVGDMAVHLQVKLLRTLQERTIRRLGGTSSIPVNARIISATNRELETMVEEGRFRRDLFYRINVVRIHVPPLRERPEDIPPLAGAIMERLSRKMGKTVRAVSPEALRKLGSHGFPGNVRELENILERAIIFTDSETIEAAALDVPAEGSKSAGNGAEARIARLHPMSLKNLERQAVEDALRRWEGNRTRAAEELGITRRTLINKIREYGIEL